MKFPNLGGDRLIGASLILLVFFVGLVALVAVLRDGKGPADRKSPKPSSSEEAYKKATDARHEVIVRLIHALEAAAGKNDRAKVLEFSDALFRQGDAAVPDIRDALKEHLDWNLRLALIGVLVRLKSSPAVDALNGFYASLADSDVAYRLEIVRALSKIGGTHARAALARLLAKESTATIRAEISGALVALGMTREEAARLEKRDRELVAKEVEVKQGQADRAAAVAKLDPAALRKAALEEETIAVALAAFGKLEARNDAQAVATLAERVKTMPETPEAKILQTNALASLSRMKASEARVAVREIALGEDKGLRLQAVELLGAFGDAAMVPVLEQAVKKDGSAEVASAVVKAMTSIRSRSAVSAQK